MKVRFLLVLGAFLFALLAFVLPSTQVHAATLSGGQPFAQVAYSAPQVHAWRPLRRPPPCKHHPVAHPKPKPVVVHHKPKPKPVPHPKPSCGCSTLIVFVVQCGGYREIITIDPATRRSSVVRF